MSKPIKIAVFVEGGVVTWVVSDSPSMVDVVVIDLDDAEAEGTTYAEAVALHTFRDGSTAEGFDGSECVVFS